MGSFIVFILKASIGLIIFYLGYRWLLSNTTFYRINRLILLSIILLIPLFSMWTQSTASFPIEVETDMVYLENSLPLLPFDYYIEAESEVILPIAVSFPYAALGVCIYLLVVAILVVRFVGTHIYLFLLIGKSKRIKRKDGTVLVIHNKKMGAFSWMNYILISEYENQEELDCILTHEKAHIDHFHTLDLFLGQLVTIIFWFNPAAWLLKREIRKINEYEADATVLSSGTDAKRYQLLLIKKAVGSQRFNSMTNSFNHSKLKIRITMMLKEKTPSWACIRYLYVLPALVLMLAIFERPALADQINKISAVEVSELISFLEMKLAESKEIKIDEEDKFSNLPLIVVNEKPVNVDLDGFDFATADKEDFAKLIGTKAADIISIEAFKDAAVISQYGDRARHGVISIVTDTIKKKDSFTPPPPPPPIPPTSAGSLPIIVWNGGICEVALPDNFSKDKDANKETLARLLKIKPEDIESIKFIESEEATRIYGKKAKDGVIYVQVDKNVKPQIKRIAPPPPPPVPPSSAVLLKDGEKETFRVLDGVIIERKFNDIITYKLDKNKLFELLEIKNEEVESIRLVKDSATNAKYGDVAKNGVYVIKTNAKKKEVKLLPHYFVGDSENPEGVVEIFNGKVVKTEKSEISATPTVEISVIPTVEIGNPLIIVDGVPFKGEISSSFNYKTANEGEWADLINMKEEDIKSIHVLKGGTATEMYGSEAKNRVVMVTTKNHKAPSLILKDQDTLIVKYYSSFSINSESVNKPETEIVAQYGGVIQETSKEYPLLVVDDVPREVVIPDDFDFTTADKKDLGKLLNIKPSSIKNTEVMRDKVATELYGKRAQHGVLAITTKKGMSAN